MYGKSQQGRELVSITVGKGKSPVLAVGGIHGREAVSALFLMRCLSELLESGDDRRPDVSVVVCPMANPDGAEIFWGRESPSVYIEDFAPGLFKNNANNINLNANFPFEHGCVPESRQGGKEALSECESKCLAEFCEKSCFERAISMHARGNCIFWRDKGNGSIKGDLTLAESFEQNCGFELVSPTESAEDYSGGFENWFRHRFTKPALCVELVKDEEISFENMCLSFEQAVLWENTRNTLRVLINTENLLSNQKPVTMG